MHAAERERLIEAAMRPSGFVSYRDLEVMLDASPATIRRDLARLEGEGRIVRIHGGAKLPDEDVDTTPRLRGTPFEQSITQNLAAKQAIGRAAAALCTPGEGIMVDGGTTTLQMCPHLAGLDCQVLTNSLHIVNALLPQAGTRILVPSGAVFREQNIILAAAGEESMPRFHAPKLFMGAAAIGAQGVMQADVVLVAAERRLIDRAEQVILLVDSSKFASQSGTIVCALDEIDTIITDAVPESLQATIAAAGIKVILVGQDGSSG
ncbi:MAG: DeoR family transcriptional regulator [Novosphingobium sp. 28-62-57]|uniref:DeoR/GlpR family DNA-binding transcription regulator n=1 Tax=unclassified Novosphingobium TaxID=2644732 RepID=UPI000BC5AB51|nr:MULTISPECIES: DeoR/GlpR family DNA-binding transcription regulator [unclassified Novosphingobium]OYW50381.1 MAG: DeoR family transcriptional regulator [Novosphingobium sp. 12-62-10]OYZ11515.1 MAG: DeoR family transcriptional regulator [Novosphingobium sp. 28-62-57]OZA33326.1 MAG: DeoR family transcriptional regulator [Novosphingobium sp. 17-62-9]HQS68565.1 DeoR/GlpR family DNA-binding transcription regulator [Novosphingobium sp.]